MLTAFEIPHRLCGAASEASVPVHASSDESALRQRLMSQLNSMQGSSVAAASPAWAPPGMGRAGPSAQAAAGPRCASLDASRAAAPDQATARQPAAAATQAQPYPMQPRPGVALHTLGEQPM